MLHILVNQHGLKKRESIHKPVVNLSSGEVLKFDIPAHLLRGGGVDPATIRKRKCSFKKAFTAAVAHLGEQLELMDQSWASAARKVLREEEKKLAEFFEGQTTSDGYKAKLQEIQSRLAPHVELEAIRGAILYIPIFHYRLVIVDRQGKERNQSLYYDPVSNLQELG